MVWQSDDHTESERSEEDETSLLYSAPLHTGLQGSSIPCEDFHLDPLGDGGAAAGTAANVGHETIASSELMYSDQGANMFSGWVSPCVCVCVS